MPEKTCTGLELTKAIFTTLHRDIEVLAESIGMTARSDGELTELPAILSSIILIKAAGIVCAGGEDGIQKRLAGRTLN